MTNFTAYLRVWAPSIAGAWPGTLTPDDGIIYGGTLFGQAGCLLAKFYNTLPAPAWGLAEGADSFEMAGIANNGIRVNTDTFYYDTFVCYDPFGGSGTGYSSTYGNSARVYTLDQNVAGPGIANPTTYYHDFQLTN